MAITFDGENLVITLDTATTVDVPVLYSRWKDWMKTSDNSKYPLAFQSEAGAPVVGVLDQAAYIRLNNDLGWRIKPPEQDITILFTGNLIPADDTLSMITPTTGGYTVMILGLQNIAQNVERIAPGVWSEKSESELTYAETMRIMAAVMFGKSTGGGTNNVKFRDLADSKDRVDATVTKMGNRDSVTLDGS